MKHALCVLLSLGAVCLAPAVGEAQPRGGGQRYILVVTANAVAGHDAEFNDWYSNSHIPDLLKLPGLRAAQRFVAVDAAVADSAQKYLAIYEVETDDIAAFKAALSAKAKELVLSPALDRSSVKTLYYKELGPRATADNPRPPSR